MLRNTRLLTFAVFLCFGTFNTGYCLDIDLQDPVEVTHYLEQNINDDPAIIEFYQQIDSWEQMRNLRHYNLPDDVWSHLADARTRLVKKLYREVYHETLEASGYALDDPDRESHFIGTPPSALGFKGVFSDLDVGMFLDPDANDYLPTLPEREVIQIRAKRRLEEKLEFYGADSGFLFDTNLYTKPERFSADRIGLAGQQEMDRYDDVLAYLALRIGAGSDESTWNSLKQALLAEASTNEAINRYVTSVIAEAEHKYTEIEWIKENARWDAQSQGQEVYPGLDEQALTRHFEDLILTFVEEHGAESLSVDDEDGQQLRTRYNKLKADYEVSLRESYFTFAAQTYIVRWRQLQPEQKQDFLADADNVRRVRADQARFILHYMNDPAGNEAANLQFKVQKIAKYEQRALKVLNDAGGQLNIFQTFTRAEIFDLFSQMKGKNTPEEAWVLWRRYNYNLLHGENLDQTLRDGDITDADNHATTQAEMYLQHIQSKLVDIASVLPTLEDDASSAGNAIAGTGAVSREQRVVANLRATRPDLEIELLGAIAAGTHPGFDSGQIKWGQGIHDYLIRNDDSSSYVVRQTTDLHDVLGGDYYYVGDAIAKYLRTTWSDDYNDMNFEFTIEQDEEYLNKASLIVTDPQGFEVAVGGYLVSTDERWLYELEAGPFDVSIAVAGNASPPANETPTVDSSVEQDTTAHDTNGFDHAYDGETKAERGQRIIANLRLANPGVSIHLWKPIEASRHVHYDVGSLSWDDDEYDFLVSSQDQLVYVVASEVEISNIVGEDNDNREQLIAEHIISLSNNTLSDDHYVSFNIFPASGALETATFTTYDSADAEIDNHSGEFLVASDNSWIYMINNGPFDVSRLQTSVSSDLQTADGSDNQVDSQTYNKVVDSDDFLSPPTSGPPSDSRSGSSLHSSGKSAKLPDWMPFRAQQNFLNDLSSGKKSVLKDVATHYANAYAKEWVKKLFKHEALKGYAVYTDPLLGIIFPSGGKPPIDYEKIAEIVADEVNKSNNNQTSTELIADVEGNIAGLKVLIDLDRKSLEKDPNFDCKMSETAKCDAIEGKINVMNTKLTTMERALINKNKPNFESAYAEYLIAADRTINAERYLWNRQRTLQADDTTHRQIRLIDLIDRAVKQTTAIAEKVVKIKLERDSQWDTEGKSTLPPAWALVDENNACVIHGPENFRKLLRLHTYKDNMNFNTGGDTTVYGQCTVGGDGRRIRTELVDPILQCLVDDECDAFDSLNGIVANRFMRFPNPPSYAALHYVTDTRYATSWDTYYGRSREQESSSGRLVRHYTRAYRYTRPFHTKWLILKKCIEEPDSCTSQNLEIWIKGTKPIDERCKPDGDLGSEHPLCPPAYQLRLYDTAYVEELKDQGWWPVPEVQSSCGPDQFSQLRDFAMCVQGECCLSKSSSDDTPNGLDSCDEDNKFKQTPSCQSWKSLNVPWDDEVAVYDESRLSKICANESGAPCDYDFVPRPNERLYAIQTFNGQYLYAEEDSGSKVVAVDAPGWGRPQLFRLVQLDGEIAMRNANGDYYSTIDGGGSSIVVGDEHRGDWETFRLTILGVDTIGSGVETVAIKVSSGHYLSAEGGGEHVLVNANSPDIGPSETFKLIEVSWKRPTYY